MAFLDKFNDWYNKVVPDDEPGISWMEPAEGCRYRSRKNWDRMILLLATIAGLSLLPLPGKHGAAPLPFLQRALTTAALVGVVVAFCWAAGYTKTLVVLTRTLVVIGAGRSRTRYYLAGYGVIRLERLAGHRTLVFLKDDRESLRIFLAPESEAAVLAFVAGFRGIPIVDAAGPSPESTAAKPALEK